LKSTKTHKEQQITKNLVWLFLWGIFKIGKKKIQTKARKWGIGDSKFVTTYALIQDDVDHLDQIQFMST
jgi:hypothetical protein